MNKRIICRFLGYIALLIGASMTLSMPWAFPACGEARDIDWRSVTGLTGAMVASLAVGGALLVTGRRSRGERLPRREAIAVVGLGWLMATVLGALPFWFSDTYYAVDSEGRRLEMSVADGLFESASGFSGTGATVLTQLDMPEDPDAEPLVPRAILFWRSQTHFLGGLGIMVLFVAFLGLGSAGKTLMVVEMPGPSQENAYARSQRAAWVFAAIFVGLVVVLTVLLLIEGMTLFDALCHAFGAIATGGFSTHNASVAYFDSVPIEITLTLFMAIACVNFTLLWYVLLGRPGKLLGNTEFRVYMAILAIVSAIVVLSGLQSGDFKSLGGALRYGVFQVVSVMTNTGFGTYDFDRWNSLSRGLLFLLMFVGGCAGSTSCSIKVIRHVLFFKILGVELERVYHPTVVRPVRLGGKALKGPEFRSDVLVYLGIFTILFLAAWMTLVAFEPDATWVEAGRNVHDKLLDCASAVAATLNGVGPGLGIVGEAENYSHFHTPAKLVLTWMMLLGRLEIYVVFLIFMPGFWRVT